MKKIFLVLFGVAAVLSCAKNNDSNFPRIKLDSKPQISDVLKNKTNSEVLKIKYKSLSAICSLEAIKILRGEYSVNSTNPEPPNDQEPIGHNPPAAIENPTANTFIYNLKAQAQVDQNLTQNVSVKLEASVDTQNLKLDLVIKPVVFDELINLEYEQHKFIMKHSPVLSYVYNYELAHGDLRTVEKGEGKIFEKLSTNLTVLKSKIGEDNYEFVLKCRLDREINPLDKDLAFEFESQWAEVNCSTPKNNEEKTLCGAGNKGE